MKKKVTYIAALLMTAALLCGSVQAAEKEGSPEETQAPGHTMDSLMDQTAADQGSEMGMTGQISEYGYTDLIHFSVTTIDDETLSSELFADKDLTIMNIWATWCIYCIAEMPDLAEYAASLPDHIQLITYCADGAESKEMAERILEESGLSEYDPVTIVGGIGDFAALDNEIAFFPLTLIFNSKGEIVAEPIIGGQKDLKAVLDEHIAQALGQAE